MDSCGARYQPESAPDNQETDVFYTNFQISIKCSHLIVWWCIGSLNLQFKCVLEFVENGPFF